MGNIARMRTVTQCLDYFRKEDPETSISEYYLRMLIKQKKIPVFMAGVKQLINLDILIEYLSYNQTDDSTTLCGYGIRKVCE